MSQPLLQVENLKKYFPVRGGWFAKPRQVKAVDDVSLDLAPGETLGLVGESGCGKSTLGRAILRLQEPTGGRVLLDGIDVTALPRPALRSLRARMQIIFQDPYGSLNPRRTVYETLREPLDTHRMGPPRQRDARVREMLERVGMSPRVLNRYPHEFSGGQRQRLGIARALALEPKLVVADEPVSALDVSVQSQVLNLLADLRRDLGLAMLFISHDLAVVQHVADRVGVMYLGRLVELADSETLYREPRHPYTRALLTANPNPDPDHPARPVILEGEVPSPIDPPPGCPFHTRCPEALPQCREQVPPGVALGAGGGHGKEHWVRCHLYAERPEP